MLELILTANQGDCQKQICLKLFCTLAMQMHNEPYAFWPTNYYHISTVFFYKQLVIFVIFVPDTGLHTDKPDISVENCSRGQ